MARAKPSEQPRSRAKPSAVEELTRGMAKLHELSTQIDDLSRDGFPYGEAVRARTELSLRETIRRLFGEKSPEYQAHKNHKLRIGTRGESGLSTGLLKELITALENQRADLLGLKPASPTTPPPSNEPTRLTAVPPRPSSESIPAPGILNTPPLVAVAMVPAPVTCTVAMTTSLKQPATTILPAVITIPGTPPSVPVSPAPPVSATASSNSMEDLSSFPAAIPNAASLQTVVPQETVQAVLQPTEFPASIPTPPAEPLPPSHCLSEPTGILPPAPAEGAHSHCTPNQAITTAPIEKPPNERETAVPEVRIERLPTDQPPPASNSKQEQFASAAMESSAVRSSALGAPGKVADESERASSAAEPYVAPASTLPARTADGTLDTLRRMCARFHLVARQLRLRKEYRPTLEINDEYDLQDLFYALLRLQFDEVGTEEWSPDYANGAQRTTYLLDWDRTAVIVKQTRSGLNAKDFAEQIRSDAAHYSARQNVKALLCFIYDPEGRVGNPRGLEADLTTVSDQFAVEVIVAPK